MPQDDRVNREEPLIADDDVVDLESDEENEEFEGEDEQDPEEDGPQG